MTLVSLKIFTACILVIYYTSANSRIPYLFNSFFVDLSGSWSENRVAFSPLLQLSFLLELFYQSVAHKHTLFDIFVGNLAGFCVDCLDCNKEG